MEREQQGEQLKLLEVADLPISPNFPVRWMFAAGGACLGLFSGLAIVLLYEFRDRSIRGEADVATLLDLPMLASVPWVPSSNGESDRTNGLGTRLKPILAK
jgi:capsular polysaccharide biosynthesis protein